MVSANIKRVPKSFQVVTDNFHIQRGKVNEQEFITECKLKLAKTFTNQ